MDTSGGALVDSRGRLMGINVYPQGRNIVRSPPSHPHVHTQTNTHHHYLQPQLPNGASPSAAQADALVLLLALLIDAKAIFILPSLSSSPSRAQLFTNIPGPPASSSAAQARAPGVNFAMPMDTVMQARAHLGRSQTPQDAFGELGPAAFAECCSFCVIFSRPFGLSPLSSLVSLLCV